MSIVDTPYHTSTPYYIRVIYCCLFSTIFTLTPHTSLYVCGTNINIVLLSSLTLAKIPFNPLAPLLPFFIRERERWMIHEAKLLPQGGP